MSKFHTFTQNNSGGSFVYDEKRGLTHHVIVEGKDYNDIMNRAESIGIYFDGCDSGQDCECCGDRWYAVYRDDGDDEPKVYGDVITKSYDGMKWMKDYEGFVHYDDGRVTGFWNQGDV